MNASADDIAIELSRFIGPSASPWRQARRVEMEDRIRSDPRQAALWLEAMMLYYVYHAACDYAGRVRPDGSNDGLDQSIRDRIEGRIGAQNLVSMEMVAADGMRLVSRLSVYDVQIWPIRPDEDKSGYRAEIRGLGEIEGFSMRLLRSFIGGPSLRIGSGVDSSSILTRSRDIADAVMFLNGVEQQFPSDNYPVGQA